MQFMTKQTATQHTAAYKGGQANCTASAGVNVVSISMYVTPFRQELMANDVTAVTEQFHLGPPTHVQFYLQFLTGQLTTAQLHRECVGKSVGLCS